MFSYAGVLLNDPTNAPEDDESQKVARWIQNTIRPEDIFPFAARDWTGSLTNAPLLQITPERWRPVQIATCWWPWGARRFARAHFVVSEIQLIQIRQNVQQPSGTLQTGILSLADGERTQNMEMWMLPAWPLAQAISGAHMWLLTLVDDRYWWQDTPCTLTVEAGTTTWDDLYDQIGTILDISIDADTVATAYGKPPVNYAAEYQSLAMVLDAVAFSCGQRLTRDWSTGAVYMQNATTAIASVTAQLATIYPPYAGGVFRLLPNE